jgi:hypothetical protein
MLKIIFKKNYKTSFLSEKHFELSPPPQSQTGYHHSKICNTSQQPIIIHYSSNQSPLSRTFYSPQSAATNPSTTTLFAPISSHQTTAQEPQIKKANFRRP